jgi:tRNA-dihydrouridine synthase A
MNSANANMTSSKIISVAPMMDWTDRHCRYFHRLCSSQLQLYTEMVTTAALLRGSVERFLQYDATEHPVVLQLGGNNPADLAECARLAQEWGYDEVNLNCGCPSDRVQNGGIGACLMLEPEVVARGLSAMVQAVKIPVTVKCRLGVDECDDFEFLCRFIRTVRDAGVHTFIIHARKAWLHGLSPKENRTIPPLDYARVLQVRELFPDLQIHINGGVKTLAEVEQFWQLGLDGVMIGRAAYETPAMLLGVDSSLYGKTQTVSSRKSVLEQYYLYMQTQFKQGTRVHHMLRHILGLYDTIQGARRWRRFLTENMHLPSATPELLLESLAFFREDL